MQILWSILYVATYSLWQAHLVWFMSELKKLCVIFLTCCDTFEALPSARADLDSPRVWNSAQPLQHLLSMRAREGWAPCLQPWTNQCQLVWQEMGRINQFNSPRSLWFADRLSDLSFYGTESLQNQPLSMPLSVSQIHLISDLNLHFKSHSAVLLLELFSAFKFPKRYAILIPLW